MDTRQLIVTNPDGMVAKGPADRLESMLLNLCGGGWNANETAEAMRLGQIVRSGGTAEKKGLEAAPGDPLHAVYGARW